MRHLIPAGLLACLLLFLVACAPTVQGSSSRFPLPLAGQTVEVNPGQSLYVLVVHELSELGFNPDDMAPVLFISEGQNRSSGRADNWMSVTPVRVPAFWQVSLAGARFVTEAAGFSTRTTIESVLLVEVPATAGLGPTELRVQLSGRRGSSQVTVPLRVRQY